MIKGKGILLQTWTGPWGYRRLRLPEFLDNRHLKVVGLSALHTGRLKPPGEIPGTHFCQRPSRSQHHGVARRIKAMKNPNDPIGNRTRILPTCIGIVA